MKLKFFTNKNKKTYTLKSKVKNQDTKDAHYKYIGSPVLTRKKSK